MNETLGVNSAAHVPVQQSHHQEVLGLREAAQSYAEDRHWDVVPGAWLVEEKGGSRCSCGALDCPAPGAHPARRDWKSAATASGVTVGRMWSRHPQAAVVLPTGRSFDVIDVSEAAGCLALARLERNDVPLGPVAATPARRMQFFVLPGTSERFETLLGKQGWRPAALDLVLRGEGDWIAAPPTRCGMQGCAQWVRPPTVANSWLPDLADLIAAFAYASGRDRRR